MHLFWTIIVTPEDMGSECTHSHYDHSGTSQNRRFEGGAIILKSAHLGMNPVIFTSAGSKSSGRCPTRERVATAAGRCLHYTKEERTPSSSWPNHSSGDETIYAPINVINYSSCFPRDAFLYTMEIMSDFWNRGDLLSSLFDSKIHTYFRKKVYCNRKLVVNFPQILPLTNLP